jgi:hypothetical protein
MLHKKFGFHAAKTDFLQRCCFEGVDRCAAALGNDSHEKPNVAKCSATDAEGRDNDCLILQRKMPDPISPQGQAVHL